MINIYNLGKEIQHIDCIDLNLGAETQHQSIKWRRVIVIMGKTIIKITYLLGHYVTTYNLLGPVPHLVWLSLAPQKLLI